MILCYIVTIATLGKVLVYPDIFLFYILHIKCCFSQIINFNVKLKQTRYTCPAFDAPFLYKGAEAKNLSRNMRGVGGKM